VSFEVHHAPATVVFFIVIVIVIVIADPFASTR